MALPSSGPIALTQVQAEFGGSLSLSDYYRGGGRVTTNNLNVPASGTISLGHFHGAVKAVPGSASYGVGTHYLAIPPFQAITFDVRAGGGGGGGIEGFSGGNGAGGGASYVTGGGASVVAGGGAGGLSAGASSGRNFPNGEPRGATGSGNYGAGGGAGGAQGVLVWGQSTIYGQRGGTGGRQVTTYYPGQLTVGATLTIVVGGGGAGSGGTNGTNAWPGGGGAVYVSWG